MSAIVQPTLPFQFKYVDGSANILRRAFNVFTTSGAGQQTAEQTFFPPNSLFTPGQGIFAFYTGLVIGAAGNKTLRILLNGATLLFTTGAIVWTDGPFQINVLAMFDNNSPAQLFTQVNLFRFAFGTTGNTPSLLSAQAQVACNFTILNNLLIELNPANGADTMTLASAQAFII